MPTAPVNGIDLYYEVHGQGFPMVFAHGVGGNHAAWFHQVSYFSRWFQVVTFDHRSFGNSHDSPGGAGRSAFVDDLKGLLDHLKIEKAVLVAQSMGGGTCSVFTLHHPGRVRALVLADTVIGMQLPDSIRSRVEAVRKATAELSQLDRVLSKGFRIRNPAMEELYLEINSFNAANRFNLKGAVPQGPTPQQLAELKIPILFLVGVDDVLIPPDIMRLVHEQLPGSAMVEVADAGHSVYFENPNVFNHAVHRFLKDAGVGEVG